MSQPEISVVIAAYNAEQTLGAQLDALARQDFAGEWEVLVCDNGSTDGTVDVVRERQATQPNLRLVDASARRGPGAARNAGVRVARAPRLAFCDADDLVEPGWLAALHRALDRAPAVTGRARRAEFNSRPDNPVYFSWGLYRVPFFPYLDGAGAGNFAVRTEAFRRIGGFDEALRTGEDLDLTWRLQLAGFRLVEEPAAVVTVSNRAGLGSTITQTFAYGVGDKRLVHKYALVAEAFRTGDLVLPEPSQHAQPTEDPADRPEPPRESTARRVLRKLRTTRRLSDLTNVTRKAATWLGFRFGRIDRSAPQLRPPAALSFDAAGEAEGETDAGAER